MRQERTATPTTPEGRIQEAISAILEPLRRFGKGHVVFRDPDYILAICTQQYVWTFSHKDTPPPLGYNHFLVIRGTPRLDIYQLTETTYPDINQNNLTEYAVVGNTGDLIIYSPENPTLATEFGTVVNVPRERRPWTRAGIKVENPEEKAQYLEDVLKAIKNARHGSVPA